ncbi:MAG: hypothetical protein N4A57_00080 [Anaeromicrobium sp.]|jgi:hypothetical protein|uniref:hypothetical protein n=1 Tax=Anaeromicrobium sp. TaxID=1929132 RepID=UPI0025D1D5CC|nr:hypothetical protein [Anaeromicrobium sp.]MCT4592661.1 hypothetical protein [Anaeromicrobium sp.]
MKATSPISYLLKTTILFIKSLLIYIFKKDNEKLEEIYYEMMDLEIDYIENFSDEEEKNQVYKQKIIELVELISIIEPKDILKIESLEEKMYKGLKLRENIINNLYLETWLINNRLWLYILESKNSGDRLVPIDVDNLYLIRVDQLYYALKEKRVAGLLRF